MRGARRARLKQIFAEMDAEGEGVIDGQQLAARIEELPLDVADALRPVRAAPPPPAPPAPAPPPPAPPPPAQP